MWPSAASAATGEIETITPASRTRSAEVVDFSKILIAKQDIMKAPKLQVYYFAMRNVTVMTHSWNGVL
jgi:hypothetical protein